MLRPEDQRPQNQEVERTLQQIERFVLSGRHLTGACRTLWSDVNWRAFASH
jgi:hypothetical protein